VEITINVIELRDLARGHLSYGFQLYTAEGDTYVFSEAESLDGFRQEVDWANTKQVLRWLNERAHGEARDILDLVFADWMSDAKVNVCGVRVAFEDRKEARAAPVEWAGHVEGDEE
jgi:hypothetical protein